MFVEGICLMHFLRKKVVLTYWLFWKTIDIYINALELLSSNNFYEIEIFIEAWGSLREKRLCKFIYSLVPHNLLWWAHFQITWWTASIRDHTVFDTMSLKSQVSSDQLILAEKKFFWSAETCRLLVVYKKENFQ